MTEAIATDTRLVIIEAALRCFRTQGVHKTTIVDIGRAAGVSRSTIYEYFPDKRAVVDAASEHAAQLFYRGMARAMDQGGSLEDKLSRAAVAVTKARRFIEPESTLRRRGSQPAAQQKYRRPVGPVQRLPDPLPHRREGHRRGPQGSGRRSRC